MNKVNTKHDTQHYDATKIGERGYKREIYDANAIYDAYLKAKKNSDWKSQVQRTEMNILFEISDIQKQLKSGSYKFHEPSTFIINERGKTRVIKGEKIQDRIVKHVLCDEVINPIIKKYLIYDNGASIKGKGINFTRERLLKHLNRFYINNKSNDGYILLFDFSKYYDNIRHDILMDIFKKIIKDENSIKLLQQIIDMSKVDVSYMEDDEYKNCLNKLFNSIEYSKIDKSLLTKEKFMGKHLNIGDQVAQSAGVAYPMKIDNFVKIVKGMKYYGRYMDDGYIIHKDKKFLKELLKEFIEVAESIGITVNKNKTKIYKLSSQWKFLQIQYSLTDTGRVIKKINKKRLTTMRRKLKSLAPILTEKEFDDFYKSWFKNNYKIMSKQQRNNMNMLYDELKEETKECTQSPFQMEKKLQAWKRMEIISSANQK